MLITLDEVKKIDKFKNFSDDELKRKLDAIEIAIREHTNNNFQNRLVRFNAIAKDNALTGKFAYLKVNDTIEISRGINRGLYTIKSIDEAKIVLNKDIYDSQDNLVTKIEYPIDIVEGALDLLDWKLNKSNKVGIASESETISRHTTTTTYEKYDDKNTIKGYPIELFGFCKSYRKARF